MTTNEVASTLGPPTTIRSVGASTLWIYESPRHFFAVEVSFDGIGRYERHWKEP